MKRLEIETKNIRSTRKCAAAFYLDDRYRLDYEKSVVERFISVTFLHFVNLEDRIIHIKSAEISKLFDVFLIFNTKAFGAYELNVLLKFSQEQIYQMIKEDILGG